MDIVNAMAVSEHATRRKRVDHVCVFDGRRTSDSVRLEEALGRAQTWDPIGELVQIR